MLSTPSLSLLPGLLCALVVASDRVLYIGQIELFDILTVSKQIADVKLRS